MTEASLRMIRIITDYYRIITDDDAKLKRKILNSEEILRDQHFQLW